MPDYKKMYHILFNKLTDIVDELQAIQQETEGLYISSKGEFSLTENKAENENEDSVSTIPLK